MICWSRPNTPLYYDQYQWYVQQECLNYEITGRIIGKVKQKDFCGLCAFWQAVWIWVNQILLGRTLTRGFFCTFLSAGFNEIYLVIFCCQCRLRYTWSVYYIISVYGPLLAFRHFWKSNIKRRRNFTLRLVASLYYFYGFFVQNVFNICSINMYTKIYFVLIGQMFRTQLPEHNKCI